MAAHNVEELILNRFYEKSRMAGGPRVGYMLRKQAVLCLQDDHPEVDLDAGVSALIDQGLLLPNEGGDLLYLSEAGAEALAARRA